jgi:hypothetical protein
MDIFIMVLAISLMCIGLGAVCNVLAGRTDSEPLRDFGYTSALFYYGIGAIIFVVYLIDELIKSF